MGDVDFDRLNWERREPSDGFLDFLMPEPAAATQVWTVSTWKTAGLARRPQLTRATSSVRQRGSW